MKAQNTCPSCQKPLPEGSPKGLCAECLMKAGFGSASGAPGANRNFVPPPAADLSKLFPQLEILDLIGQGGMGAVYRARQPGLDRLVAIKILPPESTPEPGFADRFAREARALARLSHPSIVNVYDFGQAGGLHYFIMEYVDGLNLRQLAQSGRMTPREALQIIPQMCDALQFAHDEGIVHRDIKPENVMVDKKGRVKITDFGLAKLLGREPENLQLTGARDIMGTPHYMAPEQMEKPNEVDHRADIYSLGVVFYELLTGELPIGKFSPPSSKVAVDVRLDEVVLHTLEHEPARRYQHASEVKSDVEAITRTTTASHVPPPQPESTLEQAWAEDARSQVRGPAIGLLVVATLNWLTIPLASLIVVKTSPGQVPAWVPVAALLLSSVMFVAGLKMKRLQAYWLAVAGSVLGILTTPGNLIGMPIGIWSLVILSQRRVRESFGRDLPPPSKMPAVSRPNAGWKLAAVVVAAIFLVMSIPVSLVIMAIMLPAYHRARVEALTKVEALTEVRMPNSAPETVVTLYDVAQHIGAEGLDLDKGLLLDMPQGVSVENSVGVRRWISDNGVDLLIVIENRQYGLVTAETNGLDLTMVPNSAWDSGIVSKAPMLQPQLARMETRKGLVARFLPEDAILPMTFTFQTAGGESGLLQVTELNPRGINQRDNSEKPGGAVLRFKLRDRHD